MACEAGWHIDKLCCTIPVGGDIMDHLNGLNLAGDACHLKISFEHRTVEYFLSKITELRYRMISYVLNYKI
jgi:hypothetical protein